MKKLKKGLALLLLFVLAAGQFSGVTARAAAKGYKFTYKKVTVYMGAPAAKLIKKAGKPKSTKVAKSCAYDGKDRTYKYKDFILYTYSNSDNGPEYVAGITFLTKKVSTQEGIKIGSSFSSVKKKYGNTKDYLGVYTYKKGDCKLQLEVTDGVVTNLRYTKK